MATHQEIAQVSDQDLLDRMIKSHEGRFNEEFWQYLATHVAPLLLGGKLGERLNENPTIIDLGCGPGLLLRDIQSRHENANLFGYDITEIMISYAQNKVKYAAETPHFEVLDITEKPLPHKDGSVDMLVMAAVMHVLPEPLPILTEIRRCLKVGGVFLLHDWVARPLPDYLDRMLEGVPEEVYEKAKSQMYKLFPSHNKYTINDWLWLLNEAGFKVLEQAQLGSPHFRTFVCQK